MCATVQVRTRPTDRRTRSDSDNPTARALACHSAHSASLARIFTQTARPARRFLDVTEAFRADPDRFRAEPTEEEFQYLESTELELEVVPSQIQVGAGSFTVSIPEAPSEVEIQYRIDGGAIVLFPVSLNPAGNTQFFVGPQTVKGLYTFIAAIDLRHTSLFFFSASRLRYPFRLYPYKP